MVVCPSRFVQKQCVFEGANSQEIVYNFYYVFGKIVSFLRDKGLKLGFPRRMKFFHRKLNSNPNVNYFLFLWHSTDSKGLELPFLTWKSSFPVSFNVRRLILRNNTYWHHSGFNILWGELATEPNKIITIDISRLFSQMLKKIPWRNGNLRINFVN